DRLSRRFLMAGAEALRALALLGILAAIWFGLLSMPLLALLGFVAVCGVVVGGRRRPALGPRRTAARAPAQAPSLAGDQGRCGLRVQPRPAAAGVRDAVHLQHRLVPDPRRVRALCGAPSRPVG